MDKMAYLRREKETMEIDYPINKVWRAIPKVLKSLEWSMEQTDDNAHHARVKTKPSFMSYSSIFILDATAVNEKTTRLSIAAETPVTTITGIVNFGQTSRRISEFFETLALELTAHKNA